MEPGLGIHDPLPGAADNGGIGLDGGQLAFQVDLALLGIPDLDLDLFDLLFQALGLRNVELLQFRQDAFVFSFKFGDLLTQGS